MIRALLLLLIASALSAQSPDAGGAARAEQYDDAEAYEVYSAVMPSEWPFEVAKAKRAVILRETRAYEMCLVPEKESEAAVGPAISDYVKQNGRTRLLQEKFDLEVPYKVINSEELKAAYGKGGWESFYKEYPDSGGWIELSAVGFNPEKTVAVVYVGHGCGMLCGGGGFHVLGKRDGRWAPLSWKGGSCGWAS